ncbi:MAG: hypothetical protein HRU76_14350 [Phycisphaeraceae bacterium]|nr:hypothetical protein [Phycisphaerales bacterium]QOJ18691.1 MAG: hypothetical protein HRU76_14350 [Phycisphaeraceae bacterium]
MADELNNTPDQQPGSEPGAVPIEGDEAPSTPSHPRRAASAEFIVRSEAGSASILREAMDPANQSLADALRLSYRVLQLVIAILVVLFFVSGFRSIEDSQTGVLTVFGEIAGEDDGLTPGLKVTWPYPIAEFVVLEQRGAVSILETFWPNRLIGRDRTFEDAAPNVKFFDGITPGLGPNRDGLILLEDGLGHLQLQATYQIDVARQFVNTVARPEDAQRIVRNALQRGVVHAAARMRLDTILEQGEALAAEIQRDAQALLNDLNCGIRLDRVQVVNVKPPLAIHTIMGNLGRSRAEAQNAIAKARTDANTRLAETAGENHQELLDLIERYESVVLAASDRGEASPEADSLLRAIDTMLQSDRMGGEVSQVIALAKAYEQEIRTKIGAHARRFTALYPQYKANPEFVLRKEWLDAYRKALGKREIEIFRMPQQVLAVNVNFKSDAEISQLRRKADQQRREAEAAAATGLRGTYDPRLFEREINRRLNLTDEGVAGRNPPRQGN